MNIALSLVALFIVSVAAFFNRTDTNLFSDKSPKNEVLSVSTSEPTNSSIPYPSPSDSPLITSSPTKAPMITGQINDYRYPGAQVILTNSESLTLTSANDPQTITNWYKEKINSQGFNIKTFVQTKTNDNVLNKLVGAKKGIEVGIDIKKEAGVTQTTIVVNLH